MEGATKQSATPGKRVEAQWQLFLMATGLADAPAIQQREMKRAYYAGAAAFYGELMEMLTPGHDATNKDIASLADLLAELHQFNEQVKRGEA